MKTFATIALAGLVAITAPAASASTFNIEINFSGDSAFEAAFDAAEAFWESNIVGYQGGFSGIPQVTIDATVTPDAVGGVLGSAGPRFVRCSNGAFAGCADRGGTVYAETGVMNFDSLDFSGSSMRFFEVVLHEMAHVLGFGTLWTFNNLYENGTGEYTGAAALQAYQDEFDPDATFVPVEISTGRPGTDDAHWAETWAGGRSDIMTGFLDSPVTISDTTLAAFVDLGYVLADNTTPPPAVPLPAGGLLLLTAAGGLAVASRRRKTA